MILKTVPKVRRIRNIQQTHSKPTFFLNKLILTDQNQQSNVFELPKLLKPNENDNKLKKRLKSVEKFNISKILLSNELSDGMIEQRLDDWKVQVINDLKSDGIRSDFSSLFNSKLVSYFDRNLKGKLKTVVNNNDENISDKRLSNNRKMQIALNSLRFEDKYIKNAINLRMSIKRYPLPNHLQYQLSLKLNNSNLITKQSNLWDSGELKFSSNDGRQSNYKSVSLDLTLDVYNTFPYPKPLYLSPSELETILRMILALRTTDQNLILKSLSFYQDLIDNRIPMTNYDISKILYLNSKIKIDDNGVVSFGKPSLDHFINRIETKYRFIERSSAFIMLLLHNYPDQKHTIVSKYLKNSYFNREILNYFVINSTSINELLNLLDVINLKQIHIDSWLLSHTLKKMIEFGYYFTAFPILTELFNTCQRSSVASPYSTKIQSPSNWNYKPGSILLPLRRKTMRNFIKQCELLDLNAFKLSNESTSNRLLNKERNSDEKINSSKNRLILYSIQPGPFMIHDFVNERLSHSKFIKLNINQITEIINNFIKTSFDSDADITSENANHDNWLLNKTIIGILNKLNEYYYSTSSNETITNKDISSHVKLIIKLIDLFNFSKSKNLEFERIFITLDSRFDRFAYYDYLIGEKLDNGGFRLKYDKLDVFQRDYIKDIFNSSYSIFKKIDELKQQLQENDVETDEFKELIQKLKEHLAGLYGEIR